MAEKSMIHFNCGTILANFFNTDCFLKMLQNQGSSLSFMQYSASHVTGCQTDKSDSTHQFGQKQITHIIVCMLIKCSDQSYTGTLQWSLEAIDNCAFFPSCIIYIYVCYASLFLSFSETVFMSLVIVHLFKHMKTVSVIFMKISA